MANPPIVIGPFDNVPAPGSPIRSDWTQEITHYVVDLADYIRFLRAQAYGARRSTTDITPADTWGTVAAVDVNPALAGTWLIAGTAVLQTTVASVLVTRLRAANADVGGWPQQSIGAGQTQTISIVDYVDVPAQGPVRFEINAYAAGAQCSFLAGSRISAVWLAPPLSAPTPP
jgi:hypothetical protein